MSAREVVARAMVREYTQDDRRVPNSRDGEVADAILAALAAAGYAVEWQPIETAPRDRAVLLWDGANMRVAQRLTAMETGETEWVYARQLGEEAIAFIVREPTHWMPLPKPPAAQETRDE